MKTIDSCKQEIKELLKNPPLPAKVEFIKGAVNFLKTAEKAQKAATLKTLQKYLVILRGFYQ